MADYPIQNRNEEPHIKETKKKKSQNSNSRKLNQATWWNSLTGWRWSGRSKNLAFIYLVHWWSLWKWDWLGPWPRTSSHSTTSTTVLGRVEFYSVAYESRCEKAPWLFVSHGIIKKKMVISSQQSPILFKIYLEFFKYKNCMHSLSATLQRTHKPKAWPSTANVKSTFCPNKSFLFLFLS